MFGPIISKPFPQKYKYHDQIIIINESTIDYIDKDLIYSDIPYKIDKIDTINIGTNKLCRIFIGTDGSIDLKARKDIPEYTCIYTGHLFMKIATAISDILNIELSLLDASKIKIGNNYISLKLLRALQLRPSFYEDYLFQYILYPMDITVDLISESNNIKSKYNILYKSLQLDYDKNIISVDQYGEQLHKLTIRLLSQLLDKEQIFPGILQYSIPSTNDTAIRKPSRTWIYVI